MNFRYLVLLFLLNSITLSAQNLIDTIKLDNPSFEGTPMQSMPPPGWLNCNFNLDNTPPDTQPGFWGVTKAAKDGKTYLGLVVRDSGETEMVGQKLRKVMSNKYCYRFSIFLSKSEVYKGILDPDGTYKGDNTTPALLRIWGGSSLGSKDELLGWTDLIINSRWQKFNFEPNPTMNHTYIMLEAYYKTPVVFKYNGHILVDNASDFVPYVCNKRIDTTKTNEPKILKELDKSILKEGQTIKIDKLYFKADSSSFKDDSYPVLNEIYEFLNSNKEIIIEIGGHTNNTPPDDYCDKLSLNRAKSVTNYLVEKGISSNRILYRGYGKRNPIAPNSTPEGRKKNQRVEIKIISIKK